MALCTRSETSSCSSSIWTTKWPFVNVSRNRETTTVTHPPSCSKYHSRNCSPQSYSFPRHRSSPYRTPISKSNTEKSAAESPPKGLASPHFQADSKPRNKLTHTTHPKPHNSSQSSPNPSSTQSHSLSPKTGSQDLCPGSSVKTSVAIHPLPGNIATSLLVGLTKFNEHTLAAMKVPAVVPDDPKR